MISYYIGFFQNRNRLYPFARLLEWAEGNNFSHVEIIEIVNNDLNTADCYGSVFPKSRSIKYYEMNKHYELMRLTPLKLNVPLDQAYTILQKNLNKPYSFGQIFVIGCKILFFAQWKWFSGIKLNLSKYQVCTEFAGIFMQDACGYDLPCSPDMMSLDDCADVANANLKRGD